MTKSLRRQLAKWALLKAAYGTLHSGTMRAICRVSPELLMRVRYRTAWGQWPDLESPRTFDEKLIWLNLYWPHPLKSECGDKYTLRDYVRRHRLEDLLTPLHGVWDAVEGIDFGGLPDRFVLKCTHGCKCNVFCANRAELDVPGTRRALARWMATDFSKLLGELHYAGMKPRITCEEFLTDGTGELPRDYKLYCFGGRVHCTLVCSGRKANQNARFDYFDRAWKLLPYDEESVAAGRRIECPECYGDMVSAAETLSAPFPFVRMDFYSIRGEAVLGEMTFTPSACIDTTYTDVATRAMGDLIDLPDSLSLPARRASFF